MKLSKYVTKYIEITLEIIVSKFKMCTINIQRDIDMFSKYFLTTHASTMGGKNSELYSLLFPTIYLKKNLS